MHFFQEINFQFAKLSRSVFIFEASSEALEQVAMLISSRISSQSNANDNKKQTENNNNEKIIPKDSNPKLIQRNLKASDIDKGKSQDIL